VCMFVMYFNGCLGFVLLTLLGCSFVRFCQHLLSFAPAAFVLAAVWLNGNNVGHINEVALHWARLILGWVAVSGHGNLSRFNQPPRSTQPGHPSVGRRSEYR